MVYLSHEVIAYTFRPRISAIKENYFKGDAMHSKSPGKSNYSASGGYQCFLSNYSDKSAQLLKVFSVCIIFCGSREIYNQKVVLIFVLRPFQE